MSDLVDDDDKSLISEDEFEDDTAADEILFDSRQRPVSDARRRLEELLEEKRLRAELEDYLD